MMAERILVDASTLLSEEAIAWLASPEFAEAIVVSRRLVDLIQQGDVAALRRFDEGMPDWLPQALADVIGGATTFSMASVTPPEGALRIIDRLLATGDVTDQVFAEEWAYLTTHSWGIASLGSAIPGVPKLIERLREVGADAVELLQEAQATFLGIARDHLPTAVFDALKAAARDTKVAWALRAGGVANGTLAALGIIAAPVASAATLGMALIGGTALIFADP